MKKRLKVNNFAELRVLCQSKTAHASPYRMGALAAAVGYEGPHEYKDKSRGLKMYQAGMSEQLRRMTERTRESQVQALMKERNQSQMVLQMLETGGYIAPGKLEEAQQFVRNFHA